MLRRYSLVALAEEAAALVRPQSCIKPAVGEQALVITFLNNAPFVDDNKPIHRRDG